MLPRIVQTLILGGILLGIAACDQEDPQRPAGNKGPPAADSAGPPTIEVAAPSTKIIARLSSISDAPESELSAEVALALPAPRRPSPSGRPPVALDPIVVTDCRLEVIEKQEVPSQRDGVLLFVCTEIKPGEQIPPEQTVVVGAGDGAKKYRRLKEGDTVEAGQLLALLDDRLAQDEWAIKKRQMVISEAELEAAERASEEAKDRYQTELKLRSTPAGPATSEWDLGTAKVAWFKNHFDAVIKKEAIALADLEVHKAQTVLGMCEIRSAIPGVIKKIYKNPGESVKSLEPVLEVRNPKRLRVQGLVEVQHLPRLHEGMKVTIEFSQAQSPQQTLTGHLQEITGVAVSNHPTNPAIVSAGEDGTVRVWDRARRHELRVLKHPAAVRAVACTPPGAGVNLCLSGTADGSAWLWDLDSPSDVPLRELKGQHQGAVISVAFSPDGKTCATGGEDHAICLWDATTGELRYRFPAGHLGAITALQFTHPSRLVSAGRDNALRLWTVGDQEAHLEAVLDHRSGDVAQLGVSADGKRGLFDQDNALHVLSLPGGDTEGVLRNASAGMTFTSFALFSPDARLVLTAGAAEGSLQLWRAPTDAVPGCELRHLVSTTHAAATCAAFAPDGSFIVSGTRDRQVLVWAVPGKEDIERQFPAQVTLVEQAVESSTHQVRIWAELPNPDGRLVPGITGTMVIYPRE